MRQKVSPLLDSSPSVRSGGGGVTESDKHDYLQLSTAIGNGEDLSPFVRRAFASGRPDSLLHALRSFARSKESEIEEVCRAHYQDFIAAVDDLRSLLSDVDSLKSSLSDSNSSLQSAARPLLASLDALLLARLASANLARALAGARLCLHLLRLCARANAHLAAGRLYPALRAVSLLEADAAAAPSSPLRRMLLRLIPDVRSHAHLAAFAGLSDWLVQIRTASRLLGQLAIGSASASRQRHEDLLARQRHPDPPAAPLSSPAFSLQLDDDDDHDPSSDDTSPASAFDLTTLYRSYHIDMTLGLEEQFRKYYHDNRKLQLTSDFQISSMTPFLEFHQTFFSQIAGFFIVEDRVLRTGGGIISRAGVDSLWETAVAKMVSVLEDQFSRMQTANHLLLIKDYVTLLAATLRRYGYAVAPLLDILARHRDKYHDLLLSDCRKLVGEAVGADRLEPLLMKKEYEYSMNVLSFGLQASDITPAFPYVAPFSSAVPDLCRIGRSFVEDSVSFMSHSGQLDFHNVVKKYLDRLLVEVVDGALLRLVDSASLGVSQAMQVAANMAVLERSCDFFFRHAAQLCGIPPRISEKARRDFPLKKSRIAVEELLLGLVRNKIDDFMLLSDNINWMADDPPPGGNEYANEVLIYLETLVSTAQQILPLPVLRRVLHGVLNHISGKVVGLFLSDFVKRFTAGAVTGIDTDLKLFESFSESQAHALSDTDDFDANKLKMAMVEARQLVNLLASNNPENFLNPVIREKNYNKLDYKKVVAISEKFKDSSDRIFGTFGTRGAKTNPKKKSLDALIKRLKDVS